MVQSPEERGHAPQASVSQPEGGAQGTTDGLSPNAEVQQRALQRYQRLLESDPQLQVSSQSLPETLCSARYWLLHMDSLSAASEHCQQVVV